MLDHLPPGQSLGCQMEVRFEKCFHQPERQRILIVFPVSLFIVAKENYTRKFKSLLVKS